MVETYVTEGVAEYVMTLFPNNFIGVCLDVGAFTPKALNNTWIFEERGWTTYCIEPNPNCLSVLKRYRKNVIPVACGSENKDNVEFYIYSTDWEGYDGKYTTDLDKQGAYTGLVKHKEQPAKQVVNVNVRTLDWILDNQTPPVTAVDYISIDVEKSEMDVLKGFTLNWWQPFVIVVENTDRTVDQHGWLASFGYRCISRMGVNDIYRRTY